MVVVPPWPGSPFASSERPYPSSMQARRGAARAGIFTAITAIVTSSMPPTSNKSAIGPVLATSGRISSGTSTAARRLPAQAIAVDDARTGTGRISAPYMVMIGVYTATPAAKASTDTMRIQDWLVAKNAVNATNKTTQQAISEDRRGIRSTQKPVANALSAGPKVATATYSKVWFRS